MSERLAHDDDWFAKKPRAPERKESGGEPRPTSHKRLLVLLLVAILLAGGYLARREILAHSGAAAPAGLRAPAAGTTSAPATTSTTALPDPDTAVLTAAMHTLGDRTAHITMSVEVTVAGSKALRLHGSGVADFSSNETELSVSYGGASPYSGSVLREIYAGNELYLSLPGIGRILPGKSWVAEGIAPTAAPGVSNPAVLMHLLAEEGASVTPLGSSTLSGSKVDGYRVVVTPAVFREAARRSAAGASPALRAVVQLGEKVLGSHPVTLLVYVDSATGMTQQVSESVELTLAKRPAVARSVIVFGALGAPVSVAPPSPGKVASLAQFSTAAAALAGKGSPS